MQLNVFQIKALANITHAAKKDGVLLQDLESFLNEQWEKSQPLQNLFNHFADFCSRFIYFFNN